MRDVSVLVKHLPGRHDQRAHTPKRYLATRPAPDPEEFVNFTDEYEMAMWMRMYAPDLDPEEAAILRHYTFKAYRPINHLIKGRLTRRNISEYIYQGYLQDLLNIPHGGMSDYEWVAYCARKLVKAFDSSEARLQENVLLWRGGLVPADKLPRAGDVITERGIISTSLDYRVAKRFMHIANARVAAGEARGLPATYRVFARQGARALVTNNFMEYEVILKPNSKFRVLKVQYYTDEDIVTGERVEAVHIDLELL